MVTLRDQDIAGHLFAVYLNVRTVVVSVFLPFLLVALVGYYLLLWHFMWIIVFDFPQT